MGQEYDVRGGSVGAQSILIMERISCRNIILDTDTQRLYAIFHRVAKERLERKYNDILQIYNDSLKDWNQTSYEILLKMMDVGINKAAYQHLARIIPYRIILREVNSPHAVESLLLGGSGLLSLYPEDEYILAIKEEWNHLANKYELSPMRLTDWNLARVRPYNHPVLRLAQLATLLHNKEFLVNRIISCRTPNDVVELFSVEAAEYWNDHFIPAVESKNIPKRLGREKCYILGINLVVPIQIAYSYNIGRHTLREDAYELLCTIPAENNRYTRQWQTAGVELENAMASQAVIQIVTEYCQKDRCEFCPFAAK